MRIAAVYDVHGNLPALEAVLAEVEREGVDRVVVGGDVLPGPMPRECLERLLGLDLPVEFLRGNGENAVLALRAGGDLPALPEQTLAAIRWVAEELRPEDERVLRSWPATVRRAIPVQGDVLFCHATPRSDTEIFTRLTPERALVPIVSGLGVSLVVCGHTHMQFERPVGSTRVVNAGSVGMPFDEPGAFWALIGPRVTLRRTPYDLVAAAERIRATAYPGAHEFAERYVLSPPSEAEILAVYARADNRVREEEQDP